MDDIIAYMERAYKPRKVKAIFYDCPHCGGKRAVPVVSGYPDELMMQEWRGGVIELGGCIVGGEMTDRTCRDCRHEWVCQKEEKGREEVVVLEPLPEPSEEDREIPF